MSIIMRHGADDYDVLLIATAMEEAGAAPFSVFRVNQKVDNARPFAVMARYHETETSCEDIDDAIAAKRELVADLPPPGYPRKPIPLAQEP